MTQIQYSQNYLQNSRLVNYLLTKTKITNKDLVIEIGAGYGIITKILSKIARKTIAIEKDEKSACRLNGMFSKDPDIKIICVDFLHYKMPETPFKIFANIPYNITSDIIRKITDLDTLMIDAYLIMQRESAYKFVGQPYESETLLSLLNKPIFKFSILHTLKPEDFKPIPKVKSVMLRIERRISPLIETKEFNLYKEFVTYGFIGYKPNIYKAYEKIFTPKQLNEIAKHILFSEDSKLTDLTFEQWILFFNYFKLQNVNITNRVFGSVDKLIKSQLKIKKVNKTNYYTR